MKQNRGGAGDPPHGPSRLPNAGSGTSTQKEKSMRFKNLTRHEVTLYQGGIAVFSFPSEGLVRLDEADTPSMMVATENATVPLCIRDYGAGNLPWPEDGVVFIVSQMVCDAFPERRDLVYPASDVWDDAGRIIGCTKFCQVPYQGR